MKTKKITERLFYISAEDAETMTREAAVGREKYIDNAIVEQHGTITDWYADFPVYFDEKGNKIGDDDAIMGHIEKVKQGNKMVDVAVPEIIGSQKAEPSESDPEKIKKEIRDIKEADKQVIGEPKVAEDVSPHKRRKTKGDKISEYESNEGLLNNISKDFL